MLNMLKVLFLEWVFAIFLKGIDVFLKLMLVLIWIHRWTG